MMEAISGENCRQETIESTVKLTVFPVISRMVTVRVLTAGRWKRRKEMVATKALPQIRH
jgi:hypothetical protein